MSKGNRGEIFAQEICNFEYMPGVMHAETHLAPNQCSAVLSMCDEENKGIEALQKKLTSAMDETKMHVSYQKFLEVAFDVHRCVVPMFLGMDGYDYISPLLKSLLGMVGSR